MGDHLINLPSFQSIALSLFCADHKGAPAPPCKHRAPAAAALIGSGADLCGCPGPRSCCATGSGNDFGTLPGWESHHRVNKQSCHDINGNFIDGVQIVSVSHGNSGGPLPTVEP